MHDLKLQLEVSKLASGKIVSQVTNFPNDSILHSRIFTITLTAVTPNTNGKIFKDKPLGSPELGQARFLYFTVAAIQSQGAHWPFLLCTVELEATDKVPPGQAKAGRGVPGCLDICGEVLITLTIVISNDSRWEAGSL